MNKSAGITSFPHRRGDFQSNLFTNSCKDRKNKPALALWHTGRCLLRAECSFLRLHCITAPAQPWTEGWVWELIGTIWTLFEKTNFQTGLSKRAPNFISPWSSRCFIQPKPEWLRDCISFFSLGSRSIWPTDSQCSYPGFPRLEHSFCSPWRPVKISKPPEASVLWESRQWGVQCCETSLCCIPHTTFCLFGSPFSCKGRTATPGAMWGKSQHYSVLGERSIIFLFPTKPSSVGVFYFTFSSSTWADILPLG